MIRSIFVLFLIGCLSLVAVEGTIKFDMQRKSVNWGSAAPSDSPSLSANPSYEPTASPTVTASDSPTITASGAPTTTPSLRPSQAPTVEPTSGSFSRRLDGSDSTTTTEEEDQWEKCSPLDLEKVQNCYASGLRALEPELPSSDIENWVAPKRAEIAKLNDDVCHHGKALETTLRWLRNTDWTALFNSIDWNNINWDDFDWGKEQLLNHVSTHIMKCSHDEDETVRRERNRELTFLTPEQEEEHRRQLWGLCDPGFCYTVPSPATYPECWGCFRRRKLQDEAEISLHLDRVQTAVDTMYNECLAVGIGCMDCSTARICTDDAVSDEGEPICFGPSCLKDGSCEVDITTTA